MTRARVLVATPLEIASELRRIVINKVRSEARQPFPEPNGEFKWFPINAILEVLPCCACNMVPVMKDEMLFERKDGVILTTHKACIDHEEACERNATTIAEWLQKAYPHLPAQGVTMLKQLSAKQPAAPTKKGKKTRARVHSSR